MTPLDLHGRALGNLRLSVTDRCNLRCAYCMPEAEYAWLPKDDILSFEELGRIVDAFVLCGVDRVRLTGGEPLLRRDLARLVELLAGKPELADIALTTNGILLAEQAAELKRAGLHRMTVSLDTLVPERFTALTRRDGLAQVLAGIDSARAAGFERLKLDAVVMRGTNDDEIVPLLSYAREIDAELRYIEYMDVGGATRWSQGAVVTREEILARVAEACGPATPLADGGSAPAQRFLLADGTVFGVIASTTAPFCASCDRSRLTADGRWFTCLYAPRGRDLRGPLRAGASAADLARLIGSGWSARRDRGAEDRLRERGRAPLATPAELAADPHLEMHTRGG